AFKVDGVDAAGRDERLGAGNQGNRTQGLRTE
ncbi:MAG: hypothetical protein RLZZ433_631, partial [Pseudomonadota bacterium]